MAFPLHLFPSIHWFHAFINSKSENRTIEMHESWVKQSPRNHYLISGPNKVQKLIIPVVRNSLFKITDVEISYTENWMLNHWRSLETSYNKSPFFEFYKEELRELLNSHELKLADFNLKSIDWLMAKLQLSIELKLTQEFQGPAHLRETLEDVWYSQVFPVSDCELSEMSALDLLFNKGPEAGTFILSLPNKHPSH
ncbi:MAG: hypothetical protein GC181_00290 [Bacteroidetes bacterium]|nr:hypothetical protein [Bacteroidota bacterium]